MLNHNIIETKKLFPFAELSFFRNKTRVFQLISTPWNEDYENPVRLMEYSTGKTIKITGFEFLDLIANNLLQPYDPEFITE